MGAFNEGGGAFYGIPRHETSRKIERGKWGYTQYRGATEGGEGMSQDN